MKTDANTLGLRAKILGTLIRDARRTNGKSIAECAQVLGLSEDDFDAFELGKKSPSMPELEGIAYILEVPFDQFWSSQTLAVRKPARHLENMLRLIQIRQRIIGVLIRRARIEAGNSIEELGERISISPAEIEAFELSKIPVPVPLLEVIAQSLNRSMREFQDQNGPVGKWADQQRAMKEFLELPEDLQAFVSKPVNRPYLELAQRLSEMSVEKLRSVAEGLLEITY